MHRLLAVVGLSLALACLPNAASAQTACAAAWSCSTSYGTGARVSFNGRNYTMAYSRAANCPGFNPSLDNWWTDNGVCGGSATATPTSGGPTPTRAPNATATRTPTRTATPSGGGGSFFQAAYWTQGDDPCTRSGPAGSGQPWQPIASCGSCGAWSASTAYNGGAQVSRSCGGGGATATPTRTSAPPTPTATSSGGSVTRPAEVPSDQWSYCVTATSRLGRSADFSWLLAAVIKKESLFGAWLTGGSPSAGDGLMQVEPNTRAAYSGAFSATFGRAYNHGSYADQIGLGALILHDKINRFGSYYEGLLRYNGGDFWFPGATDSYGRVIDAPGYANTVMATYRSYGGTRP